MKFLHQASDARNAEYLTRRPRKRKVQGRSKESFGAFSSRPIWKSDEGIAESGGGECHDPRDPHLFLYKLYIKFWVFVCRVI